MLSWIYWALAGYFAGLTIATLYHEKRVLAQLSCGLVLVVLLLRVLGLK